MLRVALDVARPSDSKPISLLLGEIAGVLTSPQMNASSPLQPWPRFLVSGVTSVVCCAAMSRSSMFASVLGAIQATLVPSSEIEGLKSGLSEASTGVSSTPTFVVV